jgi:hypothetical protein
MGAMKRGPSAKPRTKIEITSVERVVEVLWKEDIARGVAGANIEDARGLCLRF